MNKKPRATREKKEVSGSSPNRAAPKDWQYDPKVPDGWKRVPIGQRIQRHDYFWCAQIRWVCTGNPGLKVDSCLTYIRPIPKSPKGSAQAKPKPSQSHPKSQPRRPKK